MATKKRKKKRDRERNPLKMVFYIILVLALIACIVYFVYRDMEKNKDYEQQVKELSAQEKSDMWEEFENELGSDAVSEDPNGSGSLEDEQTGEATPRKKSMADATPTPEATPTVTNTATEPSPEGDQLPSQTPAPADFLAADPNLTPPPADIASLSVLVLNGTRRPGVAGYWKNILEQAGYTNVVPATYTGTVGSQTVIYTNTISNAELLLQQFPNASIQIGSITTGLEAASPETPLPEHTDIYILIGNSDARNS